MFAGEAAAAEVVLTDNEGRSIRFDVRVDGVDAEWYAALLRAAPHKDEISTVRVDIVSWDELASTCGRGAAGCYSRNVMTVPAEQSEENAHTVVHEYGHHLDRSTAVTGVREPNGTPVWWRARGMERLVQLGSVATTYALGWERSIAEIFAEDYAQLALGDGRYRISWLSPPDATILAALKADLGLGPEPEIVAPPALKPVSISRRGALRAEAGRRDRLRPARPRPAGGRDGDLHGREGEAVARDGSRSAATAAASRSARSGRERRGSRSTGSTSAPRTAGRR